MDFPKSVPGVGLVNGQFIDEDPLAATPGSLIPSAWGNAVTLEMLKVIADAGLVPDEDDNGQMSTAIQILAAAVVEFATQGQTNEGASSTLCVAPKQLSAAIQTQAHVAFSAGGAAPAFTLAPVPSVQAYATNQRFNVKFGAAGGATPTLNVSGLGAKNLKQYSPSGAKVAAVITDGLTSDVFYDGADFVVLDQLPSLAGVTQPQFNNSTNLATTAFVQGVGLQFSALAGVSAAVSITAASAGQMIYCVGGTPFNITLPLASTMPSRTTLTFKNFDGATKTLVCSGTDVILTNQAVATYPLASGQSVTLVSNGATQWHALGAATDGTPTGTVVYFAANSNPDQYSGYLKANGSAVSRATYASLFNVIGVTFGGGDGSTTFNLPDLRGEFIRGFDDSRGVDPGRVIGANQADAFRSHSHNVLDSAAEGSVLGSWVYANLGTGVLSATNVTQNAGGAETRPRNLALLALIKV